MVLNDFLKKAWTIVHGCDECFEKAWTIVKKAWTTVHDFD